ncbi:BNR-4 repeat-containing protein [Persicitalea sp.]|uniref:BNR-4 repeat-containing protein n=1 Tax=Persicitalea sp. TaxID=3100273 RepID=UPI0035946AA6
MKPRILSCSILFVILSVAERLFAQNDVHPDIKFAEAELIQTRANGFRGIWYMNQPSDDEYVYKYSGGLGTYPANHRPFAVYAPAVDKTFFCFGGTDSTNSTLLHNVSYFDHKTQKVANPITLLDKKTIDAHDNPVISIDDQGFVWIFSTAHGTSRPSYIHKSKKPYDITDFETIHAAELVDGAEKPFDNYSYFQVYPIKGKGFIALFTKYKKGQRVIGFNTSADGAHWNEWQVLAHIEEGHYQISAERDGKVSVAFDFHPEGKGLNYRTNLHYLETTDFGQSWQTFSGEKVTLPLTTRDNPARIKDFVSEGLNCYLLDITLDENQKPAILVISSKGYEAGPENAPRHWRVFRPDKGQWDNHIVGISDSNYDMGSIYAEPKNVLRIIGPTADGPQAYNPGGEIVMWVSKDGGRTWKKEKELTKNSEMNHTYVRAPRFAQPDFYGIWADGHGRKPSESNLYFTTKKGEVYRLPRENTDAMIKPIRQK